MTQIANLVSAYYPPDFVSAEESSSARCKAGQSRLLGIEKLDSFAKRFGG